MLNSITIRNLMETPLPPLYQQKRCTFRPDLSKVYEIYDLLNKSIYKNKLVRPEIQLGQRRKCWGMCIGYARYRDTNSRCVIKLTDKWYCVQWLVIVLAHEMAHQYQWDVISPKRVKQGKTELISHGPTFFQHRAKLQKSGIPLKTAHRTRIWFAHQDVHRC